jgi:hypothetical protein
MNPYFTPIDLGLPNIKHCKISNRDREALLFNQHINKFNKMLFINIQLEQFKNSFEQDEVVNMKLWKEKNKSYIFFSFFLFLSIFGNFL